ncbi:MAG TPA: sulfurtransferase-like selenium metabolism protein YedF [Deltaproteobacteria bacterium]|mgnify:CR=1 FL=1|nr:sulfurtransferase-like selenium metabolism protein YedF [Deltaproteobacteria bacterium]HPJ94766.1 sulfurtransferase-like selenium metabolism protein YedF [Deltaproteobacteria bacterium]HPR53050.1 sulfurtransferase-like selenium metabolism protein YedF [Deltaproteobacteria bacterium]
MTREIDARGLSCPQPVILTKKALEDHSEIVVIVDNETAQENVKRMAQSQGCKVTIERRKGDIHLIISKGCSCEIPDAAGSTQGPLVIVIGSDTMGRGDDELGSVLMKSFIHTLLETSPQADSIIFFNTGVRLAIQGSEVLEDLKTLTERGVKILVCGTCLGFFEIKDRLAAGIVSNMYDITETMTGAGRLVQI